MLEAELKKTEEELQAKVVFFPIYLMQAFLKGKVAEDNEVVHTEGAIPELEKLHFRIGNSQKSMISLILKLGLR